MAEVLDGDAAAFVAARWADLEPVALLALLDPDRARTLTADACAEVVRAWTAAEGAPTAAVHRALLARLASFGTGSGVGDDAEDEPDVTLLRAPTGSPDARTQDALAAVLTTSSPVARAVVGAGLRWDLHPDEVLALLPPGTDAGDAGAVRHHLRTAHRAARAEQRVGVTGPADTQHLGTQHLGTAPPDADDPGDTALDDALLDADLDRLLDRLVANHPPPADPVGLVGLRVRRTRRRSLVLGGLATLGVAGLGWAVVREVSSAAAPRSSFVPASPVGPTAAEWASIRTWPLRGTLAGDGGMQTLVRRAGPGARLVYADDVEGARVVVGVLPVPGPRSITLLVWAGTVGAPAEQLTLIPYRPGTVEDDGVLAVGVPHPVGAVLLLLTAPGPRSAAFSPVVRPTAAGSVERVFRPVTVADGVGHLRREDPWGVAARVRVGEVESRPALPDAWSPGPARGRVWEPEALADLVASATGTARSRLSAGVLVDSITDGSVLDPGAISPLGADGRVRVTTVRTPAGAVVRAVRVEDDGRSPGGSLVTQPVVVPASEERSPVVLRVGRVPPRTGRFLVVVPGGGATCQLLATSPNAYPVSKVTPMRGETAVVPVVNADDASAFRLVVEDADGTRTYDDVPPPGRALLTPVRSSAESTGPDGSAPTGAADTTRGPVG